MDDNNINRKPSVSIIAEDRSSWLSWKLYRSVIHPVLVCPVRVLWKDYKAYCRCWGMEPLTATQFKDELEDHPDIQIRKGGAGRLQAVADGIGIVAEHMTDARRMDKIIGGMK